MSNSMSGQNIRTTGRIKKPKAVFDPSDNYLPRSHRTVPSTSGIVSERIRKEPIARSQIEYQSSRLSQSSSSSLGFTPLELSDICAVCSKREPKRGSTARNRLIACLDCDNKVHKQCMKIDFEDNDVLRQNFKCENCRSCELCDPFADIDSKNNHKELVTCVKCVKSYHLTCHIPNVLKFQLHKNWKCNKCSSPPVNNGKTSKAQTVRETPVQEIIIPDTLQQATSSNPDSTEIYIHGLKRSHSNHQYFEANGSASTSNINLNVQSKKKKCDDLIANLTDCEVDVNKSDELNLPSLPELKKWSVEKVTEYFRKWFPKEAYVFKEHEIDGTSLLLLKRSDVIKKLPLKLGPSLRIYSLILKIQSQSNDSTLGWTCESN